MTRLLHMGIVSLAASCFMADPAPTPAGAATPAATPKAKTVLDDMPGRSMFDSTEAATTFLNTAATTYADFGKLAESGKIIAKGVTVDGDGMHWDPAIYTDSMRVMIAVLTNRPAGGTSKVSAIVVTPAPKLDSILANDAAKDWLQKIIDKELNHVAVRPLRNPKDGDTLADLAETMPTTLEAYVTSTRASDGAMEVFNELARGVIDAFGRKSKPWSKARLTKNELKSACASKAYAAEYYPTLEDRGEGKESMFVMALNFFKAVAKEKAMTQEIFDRWLNSRDEATLANADEEGDDFDIDSLEFKGDAAEATATEPTPEAAAETNTDTGTDSTDEPAPTEGETVAAE